MAVDALSADISAEKPYLPRKEVGSGGTPLSLLKRFILAPLASLKLTVALLGMATFIILVGTLAQDEKDIWEVMALHFRAWVTWIDFDTFVPQPFYPHDTRVPFGFWFPGGAMIGAVMLLNLFAAHGVWMVDALLSQTRRQARQSAKLRLFAGFVVTLLGAAIAGIIIVSGHNVQGLQAEPPFSWLTLWRICQVSLGVLWVAGVLGFLTLDPTRVTGRRVLLVSLVLLGGLLLATFVFGLYPGDPGMRVVWQLIKGEASALVLLAGLLMMFQKRGGVVLLHAGVALMMLGEVFVSFWAIEEQMTVREGETINYGQDIRTVELAVVSPGFSKSEDEVWVIPQSRLLQSLRSKQPISDARLPFDVQVVEYHPNVDLVLAEEGQPNPAEGFGTGQTHLIKPVRSGAGADSNSEVDLAGAYVDFYRKGTDRKIGTYALAVENGLVDSPDTVVADGKKYEASLRFKRGYKPYAVTLKDVRKDDYPGTNVPKNYSSDIRLVDAARNVDIERHIWMNNPLRYAGETFYQSGYIPADRTGAEATTLQLVTNTGWMIPYVACMIVFTGMVTHFGITLTRFLKRRDEGRIPVGDWSDPASVREAPKDKDLEEPELIGVAASGNGTKAARKRKRKGAGVAEPMAPMLATPSSGLTSSIWAPWLAVALAIVWLGAKAIPPRHDNEDFNLYQFGMLPVLHEGHVKPLDTLARNSLRAISDREYYRDKADKKQPAIAWLLEIAAGTPESRKIEMFRIHNVEVLETLGLEPREGFRYSVDDMVKNIGEFETQVEKARDLDEAKLTFHQKKLLEIDRRIRVFTLLSAAIRAPELPPMPSPDELRKDPDKGQELMMSLAQARRAAEHLNTMRPPRMVPIAASEGADAKDKKAGQDEQDADWLPLSAAWPDAYVQTALAQHVNPGAENKANPPTIFLKNMIDAYAADNPRDFNENLAKYQTFLGTKPPARYSESRVNGEAYSNHIDLFGFAKILYLIAGVLAVAAWFGAARPLNLAAFWLIAFTFALHTLALVARIYFSGRPPVTNLYSSAIYIGWASVGLGMILERLFRLGMGNLVASVSGFSTLLIAYALAGDGGDTMAVLQAVLDTNFWLTIHVLCIAAGYSATFVAGLLGILYILVGCFTPTFRDAAVSKTLGRMIYGVICFAMLLSFWGTVSGGLWADDSWGRFWGWDPKENGALMIVLWNALVLHARWGGMVKERGLAALAVAGNMVTAWSWFGVNQLGIGLHSYGFTEGVLLALLAAYGVHLFLIALAIFRPGYWDKGALA